MKPVRLLMMVLALLLVCGLSAAYAVSLSFETVSTDLAVGDNFNIDIGIAGTELAGYGDLYTPTGNDIGAYSLVVNYDASLLSFDGYTLGGQLGGSDNNSIGDLGGGQIDLAEVSFEWDLSFQPDSFLLATLSFTTLASGNGAISLRDHYLSDYYGDPLTLDSSPTLYLNISDTQMNPVPEPATMVLFATGLIALGAVMKCRRYGRFTS